MLDPWYVSGFLEACGSFAYSGRGRKLNAVFALALPAEDSALLWRLREFMGRIGTVYEVAGRRGQGPRLHWRVSRLPELARVLDHFDRWPLQGLRAREYALWREIVRLKLAAYRDPPAAELDRLAVRLSRLRGRRSRRRSSGSGAAEDPEKSSVPPA